MLQNKMKIKMHNEKKKLDLSGLNVETLLIDVIKSAHSLCLISEAQRDHELESVYRATKLSKGKCNNPK